jgi:predicted O-methyltransferase YrrM
MTEQLEDYILRHIDAEPERLHRLWRATQLHLLYPRMASGHLQGRMLVMLTRMIQPRRILELGTFSGYSALCLAEGMPDDAVLHTIEVNDEQEDFTRPWLEASPWADRIHLHIGDALDIVPTLGEPFDLIYIDADKRHYADFYRLVKPHLNPGGYILADNTLWDGHVVEPEHQHDAQTQGIMAFNDLVAQDTEVEKVILPMRDGLTIIRKK